MDIVSFGLVIVVFIIFLSCPVGAIYLFRRAIRSFRAKKFWAGFWSLLYALLLILIVLGAVIPAFDHSEGNMSRRATCSNHLKQILLFLKFYASDNDGKYPFTFNDLIGGYMRGDDLMLFVCPSSGHKAGALTNIQTWTDYAYVSGLTETDPSNCVVMFCPPEDHKGEGAFVGFLGGWVQWFNCTPDGKTPPEHQPTFQELTNTPALFFGTTNEDQLADLRKRTKIIYPHGGMR